MQRMRAAAMAAQGPILVPLRLRKCLWMIPPQLRAGSAGGGTALPPGTRAALSECGACHKLPQVWHQLPVG